ncbi:NAD(P)-dependent oxidoreductase [Nocardiopsis kunsanensis]|uniref:3-hydroxyisobutyrate dehydrogenase n=1 Tax=Nocardiopsis kunsanensis TaxID=141693 RepID=A0A918XJV9_9ACTN|nr:NAD(P)-dependent oxidoreductase [Nocardiopsis kunsanensis]GHD35541.1 3-hydroxyisobutyrate dehydrogenase [Nocardiopsis kunsanensis]
MSTTVAVLGTGIMGSGMAANLIARGFEVQVWNRTRDRTRPLVEAGARAAASPAEAVQGADVVLTVLFDEGVTAHVMEQALPSCSPETVWAQAGTVGVKGTDDLARLAEQHGVRMVDTPVLGTKEPAEQGALVVLTAGEGTALAAARPVLEAFSSREVHVGDEPGRASGLKLACNAWVTTLTAGVAQSMAMARAMGADPRLFLEAISGGALDADYAHLKGEMMLSGEYPVSFPVHGALKDLDLMVASARGHGIASGVLDGVRVQFKAAELSGFRDDDIASVFEAVTPDDDTR